MTAIDDGFSEPEKQAIRRLERLAKSWPSTLTLLSWSGSLIVLRTEDVRSGRSLQDAPSHTVLGIPNDGGDPD